MKIKDLWRIYRQALETGEMTPDDHRDLLGSQWANALKPTEGGNRQATAAASCKAAGREWPHDVPVSDIKAHAKGWAPFCGREPLSPEYSGIWSGALCRLLGQAQWWETAKPWLVSHALAAGPVPETIHLETHLKKNSQRKISGTTGTLGWYWGASALFSIHPGERFLFADPLDASTLIQRAPAHPLMSLACGRSIKVPDWEHENYGLALLAVLNRKTARPAEWGPPLDIGEDAISHLGELPGMPSDIVWTYRWYEGGSRAVAISHGRTGTRGTVPLAIWSGTDVTYYTTSQDSGSAGRWEQAKCRLEGTDWIITSAAGEMTVPEPGAVRTSVIWDKQGARVEGKPMDDWIAAVSEAELNELGAKVDRWLKTLVAGTEQDEITRGLYELLKRSFRGDRDGTRQGMKDVLSKFR